MTKRAARETRRRSSLSRSDGEPAQAPPATGVRRAESEPLPRAPSSPRRHDRCERSGRTGHDRVNSIAPRPPTNRPVCVLSEEPRTGHAWGDGGGTACLSLHRFLRSRLAVCQGVTEMDVKGAKALSERLAEAARSEDPCESERRQHGDEPATAESSKTNGRACQAVLAHLRLATAPRELVRS